MPKNDRNPKIVVNLYVIQKLNPICRHYDLLSEVKKNVQIEFVHKIPHINQNNGLTYFILSRCAPSDYSVWVRLSLLQAAKVIPPPDLKLLCLNA